MIKVKTRFVCVLMAVWALTACSCEKQKPMPETVIFDTDLGSDIDDVLALEMMLNYHKHGDIELEAVTLGKSNPMAVQFTDGYLRRRGLSGSIPIGWVYKGESPDDFNYLRPTLEAEFAGESILPYEEGVENSVPEAYKLLRKTLAEADDASVCFVSVGMMTNLARLLQSSPDEFSPLDGVALVSRKVKSLHLMGGMFGESPFPEFNVITDLPAARLVFDMWPGDIVVGGWEVGNAVHYPHASIEYDFGPKGYDPLRVAYENWGKMPYDRPCWDLVTVFEALDKDKSLLQYSTTGVISISDDGLSHFTPCESGRHRYIVLPPGNESKLESALVSRVAGRVKFEDSPELSLWRGEKSGVRAVIRPECNVSDMSLKVEGIPFAKAAFLTEVYGDVLAEGYGQCGYRNAEEWESVSVADRIGDEKKMDVARDDAQRIWLSVDVPSDCKPGLYEGKLVISGKGMERVSLPFSVKVSEYVLPESSQWKFHLDLWQNPYAVARYHGVEPWSEEHFAYMKPVMELLADAGQKVITATIIDRPWNGQTEDAFASMVVKYRRSDGSWQYDYTVFDKWVKFMMEVGIDQQINCFSMIPWKLTFDYVDEASGEVRFVTAGPNTEEYKEYWTAFLQDFARHLRQKGWFEKTCIAMDERPLDAMQACLSVIRDAVPDMKVALAGYYHAEIQDEIFDLSVTSIEQFPSDIVARRKREGFVSTYYTCCAEKYPNTFIASDPMDASWIGWYALAGNFEGYLRWAYNSWTLDPVKDARFRTWAAGDCYIVYPDGCSSVRFERMREGIQDYEKACILLDEWKSAGLDYKIESLHEVLESFTIDRLGEEGPSPAVFNARKLLN